LSDLLEPITKNLKLIIVLVLAALAIAVAVGVLVGLSGRPSGLDIAEEVPPRDGVAAADLDETGLLLPAPVLPPIAEDAEGAIPYLDQHPEFIDEIEPMPAALSKLIQQRARDVQADVKPFEYMGEELDILTYKNEIAEP
jgi:hypothetical protein